jgi:AcrR family transcriptional regulator
MPPGRHPLPREFIAQHQRARIIAALAEETVEKGYRAVTVADIVRRAGIARNTFYENFSSKEDCFLAASETAVREAPPRRPSSAAWSH